MFSLHLQTFKWLQKILSMVKPIIHLFNKEVGSAEKARSKLCSSRAGILLGGADNR